MRLSLAQALMCPSDLLLLDEPTNHLDLDAIIWLEGWLREYRGTLLVIAHDREFLDRVVSRVVHLERAQCAASTPATIPRSKRSAPAQLALQQALFERQQREIRHAVQFVERFRAKASKARQAQSRLKMLERMERIAPAHVDAPFEFSFPRTAEAAPTAAEPGGHRPRATQDAPCSRKSTWSCRPVIVLQCWDATARASPR